MVGYGTAVLLTTQHMDEADQLADLMAVIDHGRQIVEIHCRNSQMQILQAGQDGAPDREYHRFVTDRGNQLGGPHGAVPPPTVPPAVAVDAGRWLARSHSIHRHPSLGQGAAAASCTLVVPTKVAIQSPSYNPTMKLGADCAAAGVIQARDPQRAQAARLAQPRPWRTATRATNRAARAGKGRRGTEVTCANPDCGAVFCPLTSAKRRQFCSRSCATKHARRTARSQT
jgi:hypothetical protein